MRGVDSGSTGRGFVVFRVYVPYPGTGAAGASALPTLTEVTGGGAVTVRSCTARDYNPRRQRLLFGLVTALSPVPPAPAYPEPSFARPSEATAGGFFPNPANKYLGAPITYRPGQIVVIRGKGPTFPNTSTGRSPATPADMRYWSLCSGAYRRPAPVAACVADYQTVLDAQRRYTFVVSRRATVRPTPRPPTE